MIPESKLKWLEVGYTIFAMEGPNGLRVEVLARQIGKSKSSFYHHFGDLDGFIHTLLQYHEQRGGVIAKQAEQCVSMVPDLLNMMLGVKEDILFNRQLRIYRDVPEYKACFKKASGQVEEAFLRIWSESLGLGEQIYLARIILNLTVENFYLQVTSESLTAEWLLDYLKEIQVMVREMMQR